MNLLFILENQFLDSKNDDFAIGGFFLLIFGTIINFFLIIALVIYGTIMKDQFEYCMKTVFILLINIPIAIIYTVIGLNLTSI
jgi:hypothetical protein